MALLRTIKLSAGVGPDLPPCYSETLTTVLFSDSPYFVEDALCEISISHSINCFDIVFWEKDLAAFQNSGATKTEIFFPTIVLLLSEFYLKSQDVKVKVLL